MIFTIEIFLKNSFNLWRQKLTLKVRFWHFLTNCNSFSWEIVNFLMIIKGISIFCSLIFPNPVLQLMVLKFWKVKDLVLIRWYGVHSSFFLFSENVVHMYLDGPQVFLFSIVDSWITWCVSNSEEDNYYFKTEQIHKMTLKVVLDELSCHF